MILKRLKLTNLLGDITNCYILTDEETKETMVIDPANELDKISQMLDLLQAKLKYIYITHCHIDHIGAVKELKEKYGGKILSHRIEAENLKNPTTILTTYWEMPDLTIDVDARVDDEDILHLGKTEFKVIFTPGHTSRRK